MDTNPTHSLGKVMELLRGVWASVPADFSGIGIVLYIPPLALPTISLRPIDELVVRLPVASDHVASFLASISGKSSPWHDGFHLVDSRTFSLTHIAQFVAAPLGTTQVCLQFGGARHMTALLASQVTGVTSTAILATDGRASVYERGCCALEEMVR
jgi:hypothetical protein